MKDAPLMYFFKNATREMLPEEHKGRFGDGKKATRVGKGPDGSHGVFVAPFKDVIPPGYDTENYSWQKIKDFWIGVNKKECCPVDFARNYITRGYDILLGDGNMWTVPVAMVDTPNFSLPQYETIGENGKWTWKVQEEYEMLCNFASDLWDHVDPDMNFSMDEDLTRNMCIAALEVNYDINAYECAALRLFTQEAYQRIVSAVLDIPGREDIIAHLEGKKKLLEAINTSSGSPED